MRRLLPALVALLVCACAPQAAYFQVEVMDAGTTDVDLAGKQIAVCALTHINDADSTRTANAALGLAEKLGQDRGFENPLPVFSVPMLEFAGFGNGEEYDREFLKGFMLSTGADLQVYVGNLRYGMFRVEPIVSYSEEYKENLVSLPYSVDMHLYDAIEDSIVLRRNLKDTVYIKVLAGTERKEYSGFVSNQLADVSKVVGGALAALLSRQWDRQERMLVNYPGNQEWEKALALAMEFKWKEAVALWMPLVHNQNARIAAYASYNIAVGCEMMEQFSLAREWAGFSVKKYRFRENGVLEAYLKNK